MELTNTKPREELVRKYRELCEKHDRLLKRMEEQALERMVVSRLARAVLRSRLSALVLIEEGRVVAASPAWRDLDSLSEPREWTGAGARPRTHRSLQAAAIELAASEIAPGGDILVRVADGFRVRLRVEVLEADLGATPSILAIATDDAESGARLHRVRNHMAAAMMQSRLLQVECDGVPEAARRAASISELVQLAAQALEPHPQAPR